MKHPALAKLRGTVTLAVEGESVEAFINLLTDHHIPVWNVRPIGTRHAEMNLLLPHVFLLRPLLRRTGCKMHVLKRQGLPFTAVRLAKRKFFLTGLALFWIGLLLMSSLIWDIEVKGNDKLPTESILKAARQEGLYPFQWSFRLSSQDKLSRALMQKLPEASWIGVERQGTLVTIQVVEASQPTPPSLYSPRHLISKADAVVTEIFAEQGRPVVHKNTRVKKGAILISGTLGDEENQQQVVAKGEIKGLVWHEYEISSPMVRRSSTYTGNSHDRLYLVLGNRAIQLWGYGKIPYSTHKTTVEHDPLTWRSYKLPMGWMNESVRETKIQEQKLTETEAKMSGIEGARADILAKYGKGTKIMSQKILHEKRENGKVYMKVLFEVEQDIAEELPLVHNQGE
ncbi:sporulation protein YqfD [Paenibacillus polymyxa]|uniref:sporulation protein YqfD n=1 Tax=Paenibacillus polymyxa TaxID=1406 RepID=UPI002ED4B05B|nr:sporulation protein YqfD [Paenibacillus polymyxa]